MNNVVIDGENVTVLATRALGEKSFTSLELRSDDGIETVEFPKVNCYREEVEAFARELDGDPRTCTNIEEALWALQAISSTPPRAVGDPRGEFAD